MSSQRKKMKPGNSRKVPGKRIKKKGKERKKKLSGKGPGAPPKQFPMGTHRLRFLSAGTNPNLHLQKGNQIHEAIRTILGSRGDASLMATAMNASNSLKDFVEQHRFQRKVSVIFTGMSMAQSSISRIKVTDDDTRWFADFCDNPFAKGNKSTFNYHIWNAMKKQNVQKLKVPDTKYNLTTVGEADKPSVTIPIDALDAILLNAFCHISKVDLDSKFCSAMVCCASKYKNHANYNVIKGLQECCRDTRKNLLAAFKEHGPHFPRTDDLYTYMFTTNFEEEYAKHIRGLIGPAKPPVMNDAGLMNDADDMASNAADDEEKKEVDEDGDAIMADADESSQLTKSIDYYKQNLAKLDEDTIQGVSVIKGGWEMARRSFDLASNHTQFRPDSDLPFAGGQIAPENRFARLQKNGHAHIFRKAFDITGHASLFKIGELDKLADQFQILTNQFPTKEIFEEKSFNEVVDYEITEGVTRKITDPHFTQTVKLFKETLIDFQKCWNDFGIALATLMFRNIKEVGDIRNAAGSFKNETAIVTCHCLLNGCMLALREYARRIIFWIMEHPGKRIIAMTGVARMIGDTRFGDKFINIHETVIRLRQEQLKFSRQVTIRENKGRTLLKNEMVVKLATEAMFTNTATGATRRLSAHQALINYGQLTDQKMHFKVAKKDQKIANAVEKIVDDAQIAKGEAAKIKMRIIKQLNKKQPRKMKQKGAQRGRQLGQSKKKGNNRNRGRAQGPAQSSRKAPKFKQSFAHVAGRPQDHGQRPRVRRGQRNKNGNGGRIFQEQRMVHRNPYIHPDRDRFREQPRRMHGSQYGVRRRKKRKMSHLRGEHLRDNETFEQHWDDNGFRYNNGDYRRHNHAAHQTGRPRHVDRNLNGNTEARPFAGFPRQQDFQRRG